MEKKKVFVIMPFQDQFFEVYEMLKMTFESDFEFTNAGNEDNQQNILKDIVQPIYEADIVLADLTGLNPNVMYELGLAHTFNKKTIIITQDSLSELPFDLKQYRAKDYNTHFKKFQELIDYLRKNLYGAIDGTVDFSNPVKDFLKISDIKECSWFSEKENLELTENTESGFIDFLADIETDSEQFSANLIDAATELQEMTNEMNRSTAEIERVKKTGGQGTASFIRKEAKKVAGHISAFSKKLREHNSHMFDLWDKIEVNSLGLLENSFATSENNRDGLIRYLASLYGLKGSSKENIDKVIILKTSMQNLIGMERSLNQALRFIDEDLTTFLDLLQRQSTSIEKILNKARFVVGDIDYENYRKPAEE